MKLLIIDNYDSFTYNLVQLVREAGQAEVLLVKNDQLDGLGSSDFDQALISPGPGIAAEAGQLMPFLEKFMESKPFLGVCLGYEALAELWGGKLVRLPQPMHGLRNRAHQVGKPELFRDIPETFFIGHYHSWIIEKASFPRELVATVEDENGLIMAFRHRRLPLHGLQFHPESVMTEYGLQMIKNWLSQ